MTIRDAGCALRQAQGVVSLSNHGVRGARCGVRDGLYALIAFIAIISAAALAHSQAPPQRIISLIPAVTEMLFALGAGDRVVAVSSFDRYPPEVEKLQRVGALLDPDLERIISLRPDLVAVYGSQVDLRRQLDRARVPVFVYSHAALADVMQTLLELGGRIGHRQQAEALTRQIESRLADLKARVATRPRPRTLVVFGRESFSLRAIYASGGYGFVHDMVTAAGGENIFADVERQAVQATTEAILARRPDVIIELRADPLSPADERRELSTWGQLQSVPAVRNKRVHIVADPRAVIPGPRVAEGAEVIARVLHPPQ
jgi:iron complex transport system substrate-binding protein